MGRSPCCEKQHTNKGAWSKEEDERLINYIKQHGDGCWRSLPKAAGLARCGKSCRLRWINYLRPDLKRGNFTREEDELIISLHAVVGNKWSQIAQKLPGRTDNEIKNYWNTHIKRKLYSRGVDPSTHQPLKTLSGAAAAAASASTSSTTTASAAAATPIVINNNNPAVLSVVPTNNESSTSSSRSYNKKNEFQLFSTFGGSLKLVTTDSGGVEESVSNSSSGVTMEEIAYPPQINLELSLATTSHEQPQPQPQSHGLCLCRQIALGLHGGNQPCCCNNTMPIVGVSTPSSAAAATSAPPPATTRTGTGNGFFKFFGAGDYKF